MRNQAGGRSDEGVLPGVAAGRIAWAGLMVPPVGIAVGLAVLGPPLVQVGGACALLAVLLLGWCVLAGRRRTTLIRPHLVGGRHDGAGVADTGIGAGTELPVRRGYAANLAVGVLLLGLAALGVGVALLGAGDGGDAPDRGLSWTVAGAAAVVVVLGLVLLVSALLGRGRIVLDPAGVRYSPRLLPARSWAWEEIIGTHRHAGSGGLDLAVLHRGGGATRIRWQGQRWPTSAAAEVIDWYAARADRRRELAEPGALARWTGRR